MKKIVRALGLWGMLSGFAFASLSFGGQEEPGLGSPGPRQGRFHVLTYNVAGLPEGISQSHPLFFTRLISPKLNDFEIVLAQEDFCYHRQLASKAKHPYISGRSREGILGDGLARFSVFPVGEVTHIAWETCHGKLGYANDCLTPKGFSMAAHEIAPGVSIDIYNLHMDAGAAEGDIQARAAQADQLISFVKKHSAGKPLIIGGDWNLSGKRPKDLETIAKVMAELGLSDSCRALSCGEERIDRILFRGSENLILRPVEYRVEKNRFRTKSGFPLSDHEAVSALIEWKVVESSGKK